MPEPQPSSTDDPRWSIVGNLSDRAIAALARLLLGPVEPDAPSEDIDPISIRKDSTAMPPQKTGFASFTEAREFLAKDEAAFSEMVDSGQIPTARFRGERNIPWQALHALADKAVRNVQLELDFGDD